MTAERFLRLFLRVVGVSGLTAVVAVVMPFSWMDYVHSKAGMGTMPYAPVVAYLARSTSAFYAIMGGLLILLSFDMRRYRPVLRFVGVATWVLGGTLLMVDLVEGLPVLWVIGESGGNLVLGTVIFVLSGRLPCAESREPDQ